jgi:propionate CoA-transferase
VKNIVKSGSLHPQSVRVPGVVVDYVVKCSDPALYHRQCWDRLYDPALSGEHRIPINAIERVPLDERKVLCRRAAMELRPNIVGNIGIGIPESMGAVAAEEDISDFMTLTVEAGPIGGVPGNNNTFGCAFNAEALITPPEMFDFYDGGGLNVTVLGMAELDKNGNINVSKFGSFIAGAGGFINITQSAEVAIFCGAFTAGGLKVAVGDGKLTIVQEGRAKKFVNAVSHKTFSGEYAGKRGQKVLYVTERAVFEMRPEGLTLTEIAPGVDLKKDVLDQMEFEPVVAKDLKLMDARIFRDEPMGIKQEILQKG